MISAGEASGDAHAAHAIAELQQHYPTITTFGMGAGELQATGTELIVDCRDLAVIGFVDVLLNYHKFLQRLKKLRTVMRERKPDILILVDFPDFNLKLAETAKDLGIPVMFYVSPTVWAWRPKRIHRIGKLVDHMAVLFPFEVPYYERENIPVTYTGNPLVDDVACDLTQPEALASVGLSLDKPTVALLPGSRPGELKRHLPVMLETAHILTTRHPGIQFVMPRAATLSEQDVASHLESAAVNLKVIEGNTHTVLRAADAVICASGTATLETALIGTPMVVIYKLSSLNYQLMSRLIKIRDIALVNIVAGYRIVPELIQDDANAENIGIQLSALLTNQQLADTQRKNFTMVREKLGDGGASRKVAEVIKQLLEKTV